MLTRVHHMLDLQAGLIHTNDFDGVAECYDIPLSVYLKDQLLVYSTRAGYIDGLQTITARYRCAGIQSLHWRIAAIELVRENRFRLWVTWDHVFADRIEENATKILYFCRLGPKTSGQTTLHVEMVEYQALTPAHLATQIAQNGR